METAIDSCKKTLIALGHAEFTFEDFLAVSGMQFCYYLALIDTEFSTFLHQQDYI